jgi:phospholipid transport system substrate-binding protein
MHATHTVLPTNEPERVTRRAIIGPLAFLALATLFPASRARAADEAEAFVRSNIDKSYAILNRDASHRQTEFRALLLSIVDTRRIALFTLGPYARGQSQPELDAFIAAFTDYLVAVYERGLDVYRGKMLEVIGSTERGPGDVIVNVVVEGQQASKTHIDFRLRRQPGAAVVITDLRIEGIWLALSQRDEFIAYLQQHHGSIAELSSELQMKAGQMQDEARKANRELSAERTK